MKEFLSEVQKLLDAELPIFPCTKSKSPATKNSWKEYGVSRKADITDFTLPFVGLAMGHPKTMYETIDVDTKHDPDKTLTDDFMANVTERFPEIRINKTQSGGYHVIYSCEYVGANKELARLFFDKDGKPIYTHTYQTEGFKNKYTAKAIIETRGAGGYILYPPSEGYEIVNGGKITTLTLAERNELMDLARSYNLIISNQPTQKQSQKTLNNEGERAGDWFNANNSVLDMLISQGWKVSSDRGNIVHLTRPDKPRGTSASVDTEKNTVYVFTSSAYPLEAETCYNAFGLYTYYNHDGDFQKAAKKIYADHLKQKQEISNQIKSLQLQGASDKDIQEQTGIEPEQFNQYNNDYFWFWSITRDKNGNVKNIILDYYKYHLWAEQNLNFQKIKYNEQYMYVRIEKPKVHRLDQGFHEIREATRKKLIELNQRYIDDVCVDDIINLLYVHADKLFSKAMLENKTLYNIEFFEDTATAKYFVTKNKVIEVTATDTKEHSIESINKYIWAGEEIKIDYEPITTDKVLKSDGMLYMKAIAGKENIESFMQAFGYLLHDYFDPVNPISIFLTEKDFVEDQSNGGTGKSLFADLISQVKPVFNVDSKNDDQKDNFRFDAYEVGTKIIHFEDVKKNFDFSSTYNFITRGVTINQKNKGKFVIKGAKLMFSGNHGVNHDGSRSMERRLAVLPCLDTLAKEPGALMKILGGRRLFHDWNESDRNEFLNFCIYCVSLYLENGEVKKIHEENIIWKSLENQSNPFFIDWIKNWYEENRTEMEAGKSFVFSNIYDSYAGYAESTKMDNKYFSKIFKHAIENVFGEFIIERGVKRIEYKSTQVYQFISKKQLEEVPF
jgi:hypothetical protein